MGLLLGGSLIAISAAVTSEAQETVFVCPTQPGSCTVPSGGGFDAASFDYTASQGTAEDDDGDNAGSSSFTNAEDLGGTQTQEATILFGVRGGRGFDADSGKDASRGGDGGTLSFTNTGDIGFFGTGPATDTPGDLGADPGVHDDAGAVYGIKTFGIGGDGGDVSAGVGGGDGGNGGQGGQFNLVTNGGDVDFRPASGGETPAGGAAIYVGAVSGEGGEQDSTAGDQDGGDAGDGRTVTVENSGAVSAQAGTIGRFFWGIGVETIGNAGGNSNGPGGTGAELTFTNTGTIDVAIEGTQDGMPLGLRGIYLSSVGGPGFSQVTSDNDDDGGRGEEGRAITATISQDVRVEGQGIAAPNDGWDPDQLDQSVDLDRFTTATTSGPQGSVSTVPTVGMLQQSGGVVVYSRGGDGGFGPQRVGSDDRSGGTGGAASDGPGGSLVSIDSGATIETLGDYLPGVVLFSVGGAGGAGLEDSNGAPGGFGGAVNAQASGGASVVTDGLQSHGIWVKSQGGPGGYFDPASGVVDFTADTAGDGGSGGAVTFDLGAFSPDGVNLVADGPADIRTTGAFSHGAFLQSLGSQGGPTGDSFQLVGQSEPVTGRGGEGGRINVNLGGTIETQGLGSRGMLVQSLGDNGGAAGNASGVVVLGGSSGSGGTRDDGGAAGVGGEISLVTVADVATGGAGAPAIQAQTVGGGGGTGSSAEGVLVVGGQGGHGGAGGDVELFTVGGTLSTLGAFSYGLNAQTIGGGGGDGGSVFSVSSDFVDNVNSAVGGDGGVGGNGGAVLVTTAAPFTLDGVGPLEPFQIATAGDNAHGILSQSVGGGGGSGGDAVGFGIAAATVPVAGGANSGGNGGDTTIELDTFSITTAGSHASGILAQSVGGGGGTGGSAAALSVDLLFDWSASVGGAGGEGGRGGAIDLDLSDGTIATGSDGEVDAFGVVAQSIGGGGGSGGSSVTKALAQALTLGDTGVAVGASASAAIGGTGGTGGDGGSVDLAVAGTTITTRGEGSMGFIAQSIGGGGGNGGSSSASAGVRGPQDGEAVSFTATLSAAVGGSGASAGNGGTLDLSFGEASAIETFGSHATGMLAQSIGGGGGNAGVGSAVTGNNDGDFQINATIGVGGTGGIGGSGGDVTLTTEAGNRIVTHGPGARGMVVQSVGHGGGTSQGGSFGISGSGTGTNSAGEEITASGSLTVNVGGRTANNAGGGGTLEVALGGDVQTAGDDADGIVLQSIGGGGGIGGSASADAPTEPGGGMFSGGDGEVEYDVTLNLGGRSGATGNGRPVSVDFAGNSVTAGDLAFGLVAQSVGVGGGLAGGAIAAGSVGTSRVDVTLGATDQGGGNGAGGAVTVDLASGPTNVTTSGYGATGILAQSVSLGGGLAKEGSLRATGSVVLGGSTASGDSTGAGPVRVSGDVGGLTTTGSDAHLIVAQSISGGGGMAVIGDRGSLDIAGSHGIDIALGGSNPDNPAGTVTVDVGSSRRTAGDRSMGFVAQSIGAGGGIVTAGAADGVRSAGLGGGSGAAGDVAVTLRSFAGLSTLGEGAHGIVAQSVGGGGGIGGDVSFADGLALNVFDAGPFGGLTGTGGAGSVTVTLDDSIFTTGSGAYGVIAQSIGGGGGIGGTADGAFAGKTSGNTANNNTGTVSVQVNGAQTQIVASGDNAVGIFAQNLTNTRDEDSRFDIGIAGMVVGGSGDYDPATFDARALADTGQGIGVLLHGGGAGNLMTVSGSVGAASGLAVYYLGQDNNPDVDRLTIDNVGMIDGDVVGEFRDGSNTRVAVAAASADGLAAASGAGGELRAAVTLNNRPGGVLTGAGAYLASLHNEGILSVGRGVTSDTLAVAGNFVQGETGVTAASVHFADRSADRIEVAGRASLAGSLALDPVSVLHDVEVTFLTAEGGIEGGFESISSDLFTYEQSVAGDRLSVSASDATFDNPAFGLSEPQAAVARHLEEIFFSGDEAFAERFGVLDRAAGASEAAYADALSRLTPGATLAGAASAFGQSGRRLDAVLGCEDTRGAVATGPGSCVQALGSVSRVDQDGSASTFGYDGTVFTSGLGGHIEVGEGLRVGGVLGYENADFTGNQGYGDADGDTLVLGVAAAQRFGGFEISAAATAGWGNFDTERRADPAEPSVVAEGEQDVTSLAARLRASYTQAFDRAYIRPALDLDVIHVRGDDYTETGAGELSLAVGQSDETAFVATPSVEGGMVFALSEQTGLRAYARAGASVSTVDSFDTEARFAQAPGSVGSFTSTVAVADVVGRVSAGVELLNHGLMDVDLRYDGAFADDFREHTASFNVTIRF